MVSTWDGAVRTVWLVYEYVLPMVTPWRRCQDFCVVHPSRSETRSIEGRSAVVFRAETRMLPKPALHVCSPSALPLCVCRVVPWAMTCMDEALRPKVRCCTRSYSSVCVVYSRFKSFMYIVCYNTVRLMLDLMLWHMRHE